MCRNIYKIKNIFANLIKELRKKEKKIYLYSMKKSYGKKANSSDIGSTLIKKIKKKY